MLNWLNWLFGGKAEKLAAKKAKNLFKTMNYSRIHKIK